MGRTVFLKNRKDVDIIMKNKALNLNPVKMVQIAFIIFMGCVNFTIVRVDDSSPSR